MPSKSESQATHAFASRLATQLNKESGVPLYRQLTEALRHLIRSGELPAGEAIPPQRQLSVALSMSEVTVRRALQDLGAEGYITAQAGRGTTVLDPRPDSRTDSRTDPRVAPRTAASIAPSIAPPRPKSPEGQLSIGIAIADLTEGYPFVQPMLKGIRAEVEHHVSVRLFDLPPAGDVSAAAPELASLDGLLMMSPVNVSLLALCQQQQVPCVLLYTDIADGYSRCVVIDYARGVLEAVHHLIARGRRDIGLITAALDRFSTGQLVDAYRAAMEAADLPIDPSRILHAGYHERDGYDAVQTLIAEKRLPEAVICASDYQARGALLAAHEAGLRVPEDLAVVGAGLLLDERGWPVPLTSIDLRLQEVGQIARELIEQSRHPAQPHAPYRTSVRSRLVIGQTT